MIGRFFYVVAMATGLLGCGGLDSSYGLDRGVANYDALNTASTTCAAKGGVIRMRKGYEGRDLSDYECAIGKSR